MKRHSLLILILITSLSAIAQDISVKSFRALPMDMTASSLNGKRIDQNGQVAALIKVVTTQTGFTFEGGVLGIVDTKQETGEVWVWVPRALRKITIKHSQLGVLRDYLFPIEIEAERTYEMVLATAKVVTTVEDEVRQKHSNTTTAVTDSVLTYTANGVSFSMKLVEGGTFQMGATSEQGSEVYDWEKPVHTVTLNNYYICETEVTQSLWKAVMGNNPSKFKGDNLPVECVSWNDCQKFIKILNQMTGKNFRLPTEAEWEYAARGGEKSKGYKFSGGDNPSNIAWYNENSGEETHPVKGNSPNELGLYDMSGNVWEWCQDKYGDYSSDSLVNPTGASRGSDRVLRGGSWYGNVSLCRVSYRRDSRPSLRFDNFGFRLVLPQ